VESLNSRGWAAVTAACVLGWWAVGPVRGQGACCLSSGCQAVDDQAQCTALGGFYLPGEDCADDPCGVGACCAGQACVMTDAVTCLSGGREFMGAGTDCADDPCGLEVGACCQDGECQEVTPAECSATGGAWQGFGSECSAGACVLGACCGPGYCLDVARFECDALAGSFHAGLQCAADPCGKYFDCPEDALFGQPRDDPLGFTAYTSEASTGLLRYDDFSGVPGAVETVVWYGMDLVHLGGGLFQECQESDTTFRVTLHGDAGGWPGAEVCSHTLPATRTPTGILYKGTELNEYRMDLPEPCPLVEGWLSVQGLGDPECWFLWLSGGPGESYCEGCLAAWEGDDLSYCLLGSAGGVFGACCDDPAGDCRDGVEITECLAGEQRFSAGAQCTDLDPPCGVITGACCFGDATCTVLTEAECLAAAGEWLGGFTLCEYCPCVQPCPHASTPEGEPVCYAGYVDEYNGGCDAATQAFSPIELCETVCGEGGVFLVGYDFVPDYDWYEVEIESATVLEWTVESEYPVGAWIVDGTEGCGGAYVIAAAGGLECDTVTATAAVGPGTYWLVTGATTASDLAPCGARYVATVTGSSPCPGDMDDDGDVDLDDLSAMVSCLTGPDAGPVDPGCALADLDGDGDADLDDAAWFGRAFTGQ